MNILDGLADRFVTSEVRPVKAAGVNRPYQLLFLMLPLENEVYLFGGVSLTLNQSPEPSLVFNILNISSMLKGLAPLLPNTEI